MIIISFFPKVFQLSLTAICAVATGGGGGGDWRAFFLSANMFISERLLHLGFSVAMAWCPEVCSADFAFLSHHCEKKKQPRKTVLINKLIHLRRKCPLLSQPTSLYFQCPFPPATAHVGIRWGRRTALPGSGRLNFHPS